LLQAHNVKTWGHPVHLVSVVLTLYYKTVSVYLQHLLPLQQTVSVVLTLYYKMVSVYLQDLLPLQQAVSVGEFGVP
jgi:hypothetical protein